MPITEKNIPLAQRQFASWLTCELAANLFAGKPATLLSFADSKNLPLFRLWQQYGEKLLQPSLVHSYILFEAPLRHTVLLYKEDVLRKYLLEPAHHRFLTSRGYPVSAGIRPCLQRLRHRFQQRQCPHEIGLFLGIPLPDVKGFMGLSEEKATCYSGWKIFGNPTRSLACAHRYKKARQYAEYSLAKGICPQLLLGGHCILTPAIREKPFFEEV